MGPKQGMHEIEFGVIFLLIALLQLAHFIFTPQLNNNFITSTAPSASSFVASYYSTVLQSYLHFLHLVGDTWSLVVNWICLKFFIIVYCIIGSTYFKVRNRFQMCRLLWKQWLTYLDGFYSEPSARSVMEVFHDPNPIYCETGQFPGTYWSNHQIDLHHIHLQWLNFARLSYCQSIAPISCWSLILYEASFIQDLHHFIKFGIVFLYYCCWLIAYHVGLLRLPSHTAKLLGLAISQRTRRFCRLKCHLKAKESTLSTQLHAFSIVLNMMTESQIMMLIVVIAILQLLFATTAPMSTPATQN